MENPQAKCSKTVTADSRMKKVQGLPLLCVESICRFTPTSRLILLYYAVPLPGAFWNYGLDAVFKRRLPLSIGDDLPYHQADSPLTVFDATGARVTTLKQPEAFRFSPVSEFVGHVTLTVECMLTSLVAERLKCFTHQADGFVLLHYLTQCTELTLVVRDAVYSLRQNTIMQDKYLLEPKHLKHLLPQLSSFEIILADRVHYSRELGRALADFANELPIPEMTRLRRLDLPEIAFSALQTVTNRSVLSGLRSLGIWQGGQWMSLQILRFVPTRCSHVTTLFVVVNRDFRAYLTAFRALRSLSILGLQLMLTDLTTGLTYNDDDVVSSVLDLRFINAGSSIFAVAPFFPNAKAVAFQHTYRCGEDLKLAAEFFARRMLPSVRKVACFSPHGCYICRHGLFPGCPSFFTSVLQFLAMPNLPEAIDLSQLYFENFAREPGLLTDVYSAMQNNSTITLLLRGPVHRAAVENLQRHLRLNAEETEVVAWKDRDLGDQPGVEGFAAISQQTDVKIVGTKTGGSLKGERFTIRVVHQLSKRVRIFQ